MIEATPEAAAPEQSDSAAMQQEIRRCQRLDFARQKQVRLWWQRLALPRDEAERRGLPPPWSPGLRASLRRCEAPESAALTEGFRRLWQARHAADGVDYERDDIAAWACVAMVLADVKKDAPNVSIATRAGCQSGQTGKPIVSALRFQQLQQSHTPEELVRRLRRVLAMLRGEPVSVVLLADDILIWFDQQATTSAARHPSRRLAFRWAEAYFDSVSGYKATD